MLGSDNDKPTRDSAFLVRDNGYTGQPGPSAPPPPPSQNTRPPSPPQMASTGGQYLKRSRTPDTHKAWHAEPLRSRAYSGGPPPRQFHGFAGSPPETIRPGFHEIVHERNPPYQPNSFNSIRSPDSRSQEPRRSSVSGVEYNAPSQQSGHRTPPMETSLGREIVLTPPEDMHLNNQSVGSKGRIEDSGTPSDVNFGRHRDSREKALIPSASARPVSQTQTRVFNTRTDQVGGPGVSNYPFLSRAGPAPQSHDRHSQGHMNANSGPSPEVGPELRPGTDDVGQSPEKLRFVPQHPSIGPSQRLSRQPAQSYELQENQQMRESPAPTSQLRRNHQPFTPDRLEHQLLHLEDAHQQPRSLVSLLVDNAKRGGRISPLPQAVQGAQGRMRGPASEPGIKNEFARMFSGIGSGVGSAMSTPVPPESGAPLSFPSSPIRNDEAERRTPVPPRRDHESAKPRISSRGGRRSKKVKDEESKADVDIVDDTGHARSFSARGPKRVRQSYNLQNLHDNQYV